MDHPKTGATEEQIEAAASNRYEATSAFAAEHPWSRMNPALKNTARQMFVRDAAQWLVAPTERIVSVDDLSKMLEGWDGAMSEFGGDDGSMDHIRALIEGKP